MAMKLYPQLSAFVSSDKLFVFDSNPSLSKCKIGGIEISTPIYLENCIVIVTTALAEESVANHGRILGYDQSQIILASRKL